MRRVILQMGMSLDGFVTSDRQHPGTAVAEDDELVRWKLDLISQVGAHLMGRVTYQEMAAFWPRATGPYAEPMNRIPKVVFSHTLATADWPPTRIARGHLAQEVAAIKAEQGPDVIAWGGGRFAAALAAADLIDEYSLAVQPVAVGFGTPLFGLLDGVRRLRLTWSRPFACGVVVNRYAAHHD